MLALDFSGSGESEDDSLTVRKQVDDFHCAIDFATELGFERLGVVGLSLGGLVALERFNNKIDALTLWAPVTNSRENYLERFSVAQQKELQVHGMITKVRDKGVRRKIIIDEQMIYDRENVDQKALFGDVSIPILIIHGNKDDRVPTDDSRSAQKYLPEGSELIIVAGADHGFYEHLSQFIEPTVDWLSKHL